MAQGPRPQATNPPHPQQDGGKPQSAVGTYFLGRYRVVDEIGIGGMASVHLARMDGPGGFQKWVAIKRIHSHLVEDESFIQMFLDEARVAARISHPNVATVFELGKHEDTYWIAMEYLHGEPLRELMRRTEELGSTMPPEIACRVIADAAEGLHAAHELLGKNGEKLNLVHRDVTPHNLFVTYDGNTKVVDFGIAKFSSRMASTRAGTLKGKLAYMSPEQVAGEPLDRRTDVFALGVVLWELTTGQRLFRMESDLDTLAKVQECNVPRPSTLVRGYPLDLEKIVMKALSKNRGERFKTARELSRALQSLLMKRGLFIASDEVASYAQSIFQDRIQKREAHLRWAAEVTQTISLDALQNAPDLGESSQPSLRSYQSEVQPAAPQQKAPVVPPRGAPRPAAGAPALNQTQNLSETAQTKAARPAPSDLARTVPRPPPPLSPPEEHEADDGPTIMSAAPEIEDEEEDATIVNVGPYKADQRVPAVTPAAGRPAAPENSVSSSLAQTAIAVPPRPLPARVIATDSNALPAVLVDAPQQAPAQAVPQQLWGAPPMVQQQQQQQHQQYQQYQQHPQPPYSPIASGAFPPQPNYPPPPSAQQAPPPRDQRTVAVKALKKGVPMWAVTVLSGVAALALLAAVYFVAVPGKGPTKPVGPTALPGTGPFGAARAKFTDVITPAPTSSIDVAPSASAAPPVASASAAPADSASPAPTVAATPTATAAALGTNPTPQPIRTTGRPAPLPLPASPYVDNKVSTGQLTVICVPACDGVYEGSTSLGAPPIYKKTLPVGTHRIRLVSNNPSVTKTISVMIMADQVDLERVSMTP